MRYGHLPARSVMCCVRYALGFFTSNPLIHYHHIIYDFLHIAERKESARILVLRVSIPQVIKRWCISLGQCFMISRFIFPFAEHGHNHITESIFPARYLLRAISNVVMLFPVPCSINRAPTFNFINFSTASI